MEPNRPDELQETRIPVQRFVDRIRGDEWKIEGTLVASAAGIRSAASTPANLGITGELDRSPPVPTGSNTDLSVRIKLIRGA